MPRFKMPQAVRRFRVHISGTGLGIHVSIAISALMFLLVNAVSLAGLYR
jgi:hypothetical protein